MNKKDFKKLIKPIVKECINEAILESGLLSSVISEVVKGLGAPALNEGKNNDRATAAQEEKNKIIVEQKRKLNNEKLAQTRKKLLSSINADAYGGVDLFEGTTPMSSVGSAKTPSASSPLAGVDPNDAGIDISGILNIGGDKWSKLV
mgnify:CR=1 FL=1|tara:strand:+ start:782 stop:1222 length:441 start_codon:yes stop_codon:yes gene_type:complete